MYDDYKHANENLTSIAYDLRLLSRLDTRQGITNKVVKEEITNNTRLKTFHGEGKVAKQDNTNMTHS